MSTRCVKTLFTRTVLCAGTMTDYVSIKERVQQGTTPNNPTVTEVFSEVVSCFAKLEARNPTQRFDGVNVADSITHICYVPFEQTVYELDINSLFLDFEGKNRSRRFKLLSILNIDEQDEYLGLYLKETGFTDLEASKG